MEGMFDRLPTVALDEIWSGGISFWCRCGVHNLAFGPAKTDDGNHEPYRWYAQSPLSVISHAYARPSLCEVIT